MGKMENSIEGLIKVFTILGGMVGIMGLFAFIYLKYYIGYFDTKRKGKEKT